MNIIKNIVTAAALTLSLSLCNPTNFAVMAAEATCSTGYKPIPAAELMARVHKEAPDDKQYYITGEDFRTLTMAIAVLSKIQLEEKDFTMMDNIVADDGPGDPAGAVVHFRLGLCKVGAMHFTSEQWKDLLTAVPNVKPWVPGTPVSNPNPTVPLEGARSA